MPKFSDKLMKKILFPATNRLLEASYGVYLSTTADPMPYEEWCTRIKCMMEYPNEEQTGFIENND